MMRRLLLALAISCGAQAEPQPFGWCCSGICGLDATDAADAGGECTCDGVIRPTENPLEYACLEDWTR